MVTAGPGFLKVKKLNPGPAPTSQNPPIISVLSGAGVLQNQNPGPAPTQEKHIKFPGKSRGRGFRNSDLETPAPL